MKGGYLIAKGKDCYNELLRCIGTEYGEHPKSSIIDGFIFFIEDYSFLNSSELMTVIRIQKTKKTDDECEIEVITGGGATGMLSVTYGNESTRVNKALKLVTEFCLANGYEYSPIAYKKNDPY